MAFMDQVQGQINIGGTANLGTLTQTKQRKRSRRAGLMDVDNYSLLPKTETYAIKPLDNFSKVYDPLSPASVDKVQADIGGELAEQTESESAAGLRNVFEKYLSAAPTGTTKGSVYYQDPVKEDDDDGDDDEEPCVEDDPIDYDPGSFGDNSGGGASTFSGEGAAASTGSDAGAYSDTGGGSGATFAGIGLD